MKKNILTKWPVLFFAAVLLASCHEDKGNYDYIELDDLQFTGINPNYRINMGEPLTIRPELVNATGSESDYEYVWLRAGSNTGGIIWDTIHRSKYIENEVLNILRPSDVAYPIVYQVKDKRFGDKDITYTSDYFYIKVDKDVSAGFLILTNNDGKTDLKFLNYINNDVTRVKKLDLRTVDLFELPENLGKPVSIVTYGDSNAPRIGGSLANDGLYAVSLVTETGLYRLRWNDFHYEDLYNGKYVIGGNVDNIQIKGMYATSDKAQYTAMLKDQTGNFMMYQRGVGMDPTLAWAEGIYCNKYLGTDGNPDVVFNACPSFGYCGSYAVFYDMDSKSFAVRSGGKNSCVNFNAEEPMFKYNNTPFEPVWIFTRYQSSVYQTYSVVKDRATGDLSVISFNTGNGAQLSNLKMTPTTPGGTILPNVANAKFFAMNGSRVVGYGPLLYYATDNAAYVFNILDESVEKVFDAPAGTTIKEMKFTTRDGDYSSAPPIRDFEDHMFIVTEGTTPNSTTVELYEVAQTYGTLTLKQLGFDDGEKMACRWTGLPSYVALDYKNR